MEEWPPTKPPTREESLKKGFSGKGFEVIGNPERPGEEIELWFQDGQYAGHQTPVGEYPQWTPATDKVWKRRRRQAEAEALALNLRENPGDTESARDLKAIRKKCREEIPRDRITERAVKKILAGGNPTNWPMQGERERAALIALMELSIELQRPPTEVEVVDKMRCLTVDSELQKLAVKNLKESLNRDPTGSEIAAEMEKLRASHKEKQGGRIISDGCDKNLKGFLRENGLSWLERRGRGNRVKG